MDGVSALFFLIGRCITLIYNMLLLQPVTSLYPLPLKSLSRVVRTNRPGCVLYRLVVGDDDAVSCRGTLDFIADDAAAKRLVAAIIWEMNEVQRKGGQEDVRGTEDVAEEEQVSRVHKQQLASSTRCRSLAWSGYCYIPSPSSSREISNLSAWYRHERGS